MGFFKQLYKVDYVVIDSLPSRGKFQDLLQEKKDGLVMCVLIVKIHKAIFDMDPLKTPGVDGFYAKFYQAHWDIIALSICQLVR